MKLNENLMSIWYEIDKNMRFKQAYIYYCRMTINLSLGTEEEWTVIAKQVSGEDLPDLPKRSVLILVNVWLTEDIGKTRFRA